MYKPVANGQEALEIMDQLQKTGSEIALVVSGVSSPIDEQGA